MINLNENILLMVSIFLFTFFLCAESLASEPSLSVINLHHPRLHRGPQGSLASTIG